MSAHTFSKFSIPKIKSASRSVCGSCARILHRTTLADSLHASCDIVSHRPWAARRFALSGSWTNKQIEAPAQDQGCKDGVEYSLLNGWEIALFLINPQGYDDKSGKYEGTDPSESLPGKKSTSLACTIKSFGRPRRSWRVQGLSLGAQRSLVGFRGTFPNTTSVGR